jgi:hypothetical protein
MNNISELIAKYTNFINNISDENLTTIALGGSAIYMDSDYVFSVLKFEYEKDSAYLSVYGHQACVGVGDTCGIRDVFSFNRDWADILGQYDEDNFVDEAYANCEIVATAFRPRLIADAQSDVESAIQELAILKEEAEEE